MTLSTPKYGKICCPQKADFRTQNVLPDLTSQFSHAYQECLWTLGKTPFQSPSARTILFKASKHPEYLGCKPWATVRPSACILTLTRSAGLATNCTTSSKQKYILEKAACGNALNDLIDSKSTNSNIKATIAQPSQIGTELGDKGVSMDNFDDTIKVLVLSSWTSKDLAAAIWVPVDVLNLRVNFWISKEILAESLGTDSEDYVFTRMEGMVDAGKNGGNNGRTEDLVVGDEEGESSVASVEDQLRKEMTVYAMFCIAVPPYDETLPLMLSFLWGLVSEEKLELRDRMHFMKK